MSTRARWCHATDIGNSSSAHHPRDAYFAASSLNSRQPGHHHRLRSAERRNSPPEGVCATSAQAHRHIEPSSYWRHRAVPRSGARQLSRTRNQALHCAGSAISVLVLWRRRLRPVLDRALKSSRLAFESHSSTQARPRSVGRAGSLLFVAGPTSFCVRSTGNLDGTACCCRRRHRR